MSSSSMSTSVSNSEQNSSSATHPLKHSFLQTNSSSSVPPHPSIPVTSTISKSRSQTTIPGMLHSPSYHFRQPSLSAEASTAHSYELIWQDISNRVLPLFNGEGLKGAIEELNQLVRNVMKGFVVPVLMDKLEDLLMNGIEVLNQKLTGVQEEKLATRIMEIWSFYFGTVLPYFQGVFLPLQQELKHSTSYRKSIRLLMLTVFRNQFLFPLLDRMQDALIKLLVDHEEARRSPDTFPRMLQMLTILLEIQDESKKHLEACLQKIKNEMKRYGRSSHLTRSEDRLYP